MSENVRVGQPTLYTGDIELTASFYRRLGFEEAYRFPPTGDQPPAFIAMHLGTFYLTLAQLDIVRAQTGLPDLGMATSRQFDITIIVDDVDGLVADLGAPVVLAPRDEPWGDRHAYVTDPDGNYIQITTHADHDISQFTDFTADWGTPQDGADRIAS